MNAVARDDGWHRLHPLSPAVRAGRMTIAILVVLLPSFVVRSGNRGDAIVNVVVLGVLLGVGVVSWLVTRWRIEGGDLRIETGLVRRRSLRFPLAQVQAIDTVRPGIARVLGLSELRLRMGGSSGASARLAYLPAPQAEALRARLLALARGAAAGGEEEEAEEPPEEVLFTVPPGRLVASILLSGLGVGLLVETLVLVGLAEFAPSVLAASVSGGVVPALGLVVGVWRRFNGDYRLTVAVAPDGLRVRAGLVETTAETIPRGRVQAVQIVEPILWRPLGWCRLEVDIAGRQRQKGEDRAEGKQLHSLLPVGSREVAWGLLARIVADAPSPTNRPPRRARWKSPLRYRNLAWAHTAMCAVTSGGRLGRVTSWVPLAKVQSLREVQGPLQRRLGLATVHLDTAGRNVGAAFRDCADADAARLVEELTELSRAARRA